MSKNLSLTLAQRVQRIKPSPTLQISAQAEALKAEGKQIINLSVGEPDFNTPDLIKEAAIKAIWSYPIKYTAVDGIKPLKEAVVKKFRTENHLDYAIDQVIVSTGAKQSLYNLFAAIINTEDEVIIPAPYWVSYPDMVKLNDGMPVIVKTDLSQGFKMTPSQLEGAITERTRAIIINSPSNPSGMAYTKEELIALAEVILPYPNILVVTDDIYEHNLWNHTSFVNIVNASPKLKDRTLVVNGVSKAYAMTGWRIGYAAGPKTIIAAMKKIQSQTTSNPNTVAQYAALEALSGEQQSRVMMTETYKKRHDFVYEALQACPGINCLPSDGTFYLFPCIEELTQHSKIKNDLEFAELLLQEAGIAIVPGTAFGSPQYFRLSFATSMDLLEEALGKLKQVIIELMKT